MKNIVTLLFGAVMAAALTACSDDADSPQTVGNIITPEVHEEPVTDQLAVTVTATLPTAVFGQFDDNSTGAALLRRLSAPSADIDFNSRLVLLQGSVFDGTAAMSQEQLYAMVAAYLSGGYIAIERPTMSQLEHFNDAFVDAAVQLQEDLLTENFDLDEEEAEAAARTSAQAARMQARMANVRGYATRATRAAADDVVAELLIISPMDYFYQEPFMAENTISTQTQDGDNPLSEPVTVTVTAERNAYRSGLMADAAAQWLNDAEARQAETAAASAAITRAAGADAINNMMSASETFTFSGQMYWRDGYNHYCWSDGRVQQTIRSWGVHNFASNKDYYYVQQNVSLNMGARGDNYLLSAYDSENCWSDATGYGYWNCYYGSFLSEYATSMALTGKGDILLEAALPETENTSSTQSVNIGQSGSSSQTAGVTWGATIGINGANLQATVTGGGSFSAGVTSGTSFSVNSSKTLKEITPVKNRVGNKVTWTYKGNLPKFRVERRDQHYYYMHGTAPDILVNTANVTNEICWSVANPEGSYTLNVTSYPQTAALMYHHEKTADKTSSEGHYEYTNCWVDNNFSHVFLQPNRYQQRWNMSVTVDETAGTDKTGLGSALEKRIAEQYPNIFQREFTVADKTAESLEMANAFIAYSKGVFGEQYDILQNMAADQGIRKFTINWRRQGSKAKESFTVLVDGYNSLEADGGMDTGDFKVANLFDSNYYTKWMVENTQATPSKDWYVEFHAPSVVSPKGYAMVTATDAAQNYVFNPCEWRLYGRKSKGDKWVLLATVNDRNNKGDGLPWTNSTVKAKQFDVAPNAMQYFRLEADSWSYAMQLAEFYFTF